MRRTMTRDEAEVEKRVAVVTGGRRGIGRGVAFALAESGFDLVLVDLITDDAAAAETLAGVERRGARCRWLRADIAEVALATALCDDAHAVFGRVDVLVNNAGVQVADRTIDVLHTGVESFDRLLGVNLRGTFFVTQAFALRMVAGAAAQGNHRAIVTISSSNAEIAKTRGVEYCLSKSALAMLNKIFALQLAPHGIACYEVRPGLIKTDMNAALHARYEPLVNAGMTPMPRWGTAEDVGRTVAALAGGALRFCTGEVIHVDGGLHIARSPLENPFVRRQLG